MYIGRVGEKKPIGLYTVAMIVTTKEEHIELNDAVYWLWLSVHAVLLHACMPDQVGEITIVRISSVE